MFEITEDGQITSYTGNVFDLIIPDRINGIAVKSIAPEVFSDSGLVGVTFPSSMDSVSTRAFYECKSLMLADGNGINTIESEAFYGTGLYLVDFPEVKTIKNYGLAGIDFLGGIYRSVRH